jgi:hypothetical protein
LAALVLLVFLLVVDGLLGVAWLAWCWLAWCWLACCWLAVGLVVLGCEWITGLMADRWLVADRWWRADRWLACGWLVALVSQKFLLLLWASSIQARCV